MYVVWAFVVISLFLHFDLSEIIASAHYTSTASPLQKHVHYPCFTLSDAVIYNVVLEEHWHLPTIVNRRTDIKREYFQGSRFSMAIPPSTTFEVSMLMRPGVPALRFPDKKCTGDQQPPARDQPWWKY